ncbi:membrane protein insertase YidC [Pannonibacter tanglangensis]|uniref:Membrane protein insertase YidC n=1 Tax=Pannonibacter tanglangensis TaxID=2750084 RepID=A0ABW9ZIF7_9HYPH|nr:membrane protein insertase YidC [Pannonibacter sp. XCT-34]NBN64632.1 membrane protein insertase YidC [Pannonibacter sp. XCT-34]
MADNRNTIIAIVLSLIIVLGWQYFVVGPQLEQQRIEMEQQQAAAQQAADAQAPVPGAAAGSASIPGSTAGAASGVLTRDAALASSARVTIDTPRLSGSISLTGGRVDDIRLKDYHETVDRSSPTIVLFSPKGSQNAYYADYGWVSEPGATVALPGPDTVWTASGTALSPQTPVTLTWDNGAGLVFTRTFAIDENYMFTVTQGVTNTSAAAVSLYPYGLIARRGTPKTQNFYILHEGLIGVVGEKGLTEVDYSEAQEEKQIKPGQSDKGWLGITDKYWAATLAPVAGSTFEPSFSYNAATDIYQADFLGTVVTVQPGASGDAASYLFAGAKETKLIDSYEATLKIEGFELLIDWGWFYFLTKPMFFVIDWLFHLVGNFGVAILLVTVLVKLIFFPLANKSYVSMSKMKLVQPQMMDIREKYKDDKAKQQQALMELYKTEKINPLAGCLPVLIQIPVFFALYKVLFVTIEMRHAPFFGWIHDLSAPDPTTIFNLFGLIPWDPPTFLMLGVWPLIMGVTMFVQMKMNPAPTDPAQQIIFNWMPVLFTFMLASFPAGLVIYWAWNNSLSIAQQYVIMRRQGVKVELWDNLSTTFKRKKGETGA